MRKSAWAALAAAAAVGILVLVTTYAVPWDTTGIGGGLTLLVPILVSILLGLLCPTVVGLTCAAWMATTIELNNGYVNPFVLVFTFAPWFVGRVIADRHALTRRLTSVGHALEEENQRLAEEAVRLERARIARELHDVVAHCVSVMVVQAYAGERLASVDPDSAAQAFDDIADAARQAGDEITHLVDLLGGHPLSESKDPLGPALQELVAGAVSAGLDVELTIRGDPAALAQREASLLYRVAEEGMTNALKHAPGSSIRIWVEITDAVEVHVVNDAGRDGTSPLASVIGGHGLHGLSERVAGLGGTMEAGPESQGWWRLAVRFPMADSRGPS